MPYADSAEWQRFSRFLALEELVFLFECFAQQLNRKGAYLDVALSLALPNRANILVTERGHLMESSVTQLGFDAIYHESGGHQFGGLRPLHRALLPAQIEPWHLHALKMSLEEAGMERERRRDHGALLLGPLAEGEGPASWLAEIAEVREEIAMKD